MCIRDRDNFDEFFGIIKILSMQGLPKGKKIEIITNGAGPSVLSCDFIDMAENLELVNVNDLTGSATADDYIDAIDKSKAEIILLVFVFQDAPLAESLEKFYEEIKKRKRFYVALALGGKFVEEQKKRLAELKIPVFEEPSIVITSLNKIVEYAMKNESRSIR